MTASARLGPRFQDQYYWLTSVLAARGLQTTTCRLVAGSMFGLGVIPALMMVRTIGADSLRGPLLAVIVTVCCAVMGFRWLRRSWPSRIESQLCVVIGTVCFAVAALTQGNPVIGLLGSNGFAVLSAFIAFFHTPRLLAFTWAIAAVTLGVLAMRLAPIDTALALSNVILVALVNVFIAFTCRMVVRLMYTEVSFGELEPLTGLLNRDAFCGRFATLLGARTRDDDRHLIVVVVNLDSFSLLTAMGGVAGGNRARIAIAQCLRETVRRETIVAHVSEAEFLVADLFTTLDPSPLSERIRGAITTAPFRLTASVGVVSIPLGPLVSHPPYDVLDELLSIATTAMYDARKAGGNQVRQVLAPPLTSIEDPDN